MNEKSYIIQCNNCKTKNRIPKSRINDRPLCGKCHTPLPVVNTYNTPVDISDDTFENEVLSYPGPVLVDCWAPWCGPCKIMGPVMEQLASEYAGRVKIAKLNIDQNPAIASKYQIMSIPTLLLFKNGQVVNSIVGAVQKSEIDRQLRAII